MRVSIFQIACFSISAILLISVLVIKICGHLNNRDEEEEEEEPIEKDKKPKKLRKPGVGVAIAKELVFWLVPIIAVIVLFLFVLMIGIEQTASMAPTLEVGGIQITNRLAYKNHPVERGDIITFDSPEPEDDRIMVKRVVGLPGETISFVDGEVYIDGIQLPEAYLADDVETNSYHSFLVPPDHYFVMGDNRENSFDSRDWINTFVSRGHIHGKLVFNANPIWKKTPEIGNTKEPIILSMNDSGGIWVYSKGQSEAKPVQVIVYAILSHEEVCLAIDNYIFSGESPYSSAPTLPSGCHWEGIAYTVGYNAYTDVSADSYVNVKLCDSEGKPFGWNGTEYTKKTHDIIAFSRLDEDNVRHNLICYYPIPDGCDSYTLEIGEGSLNNSFQRTLFIKSPSLVGNVTG